MGASSIIDDFVPRPLSQVRSREYFGRMHMQACVLLDAHALLQYVLAFARAGRTHALGINPTYLNARGDYAHARLA